MKFFTVSETSRMRRALIQMNPNYKWTKEVNLMTPERVHDQYIKFASKDKFNK